MRLIYDLTGKRFGKLLVLKRGWDIYRGPGFKCLCDCGRKENVRSCELRGGARVACRKCSRVKVGAVLGSKYKCSSRMHDKPLTKKQVKEYRKKLNDSEYVEEAIEGAAMKMTDVLFALILRDRQDDRR